jgi:hypothetical protein
MEHQALHVPPDAFHLVPYLVAAGCILIGALAVSLVIRRLNRQPATCSRCLVGQLIALTELPLADQSAIAAASRSAADGPEFDQWRICPACRHIYDEHSVTVRSTHEPQELLTNFASYDWECSACTGIVPGNEFDCDRLVCPSCQKSFAWQPCGTTGYQWFQESPATTSGSVPTTAA